MIAGQCITGAVAVTHPNETVAGKVLIAFSCIFVAGEFRGGLRVAELIFYRFRFLLGTRRLGCVR